MKIVKLLFIPFLFPHIYCYLLSPEREKINADLVAFSQGYGFFNSVDEKIGVKRLLKVLLKCPEFRNIFYTRINGITKKYHLGYLLEMILPKQPFLSIGTPADKIGKGLYVEHGFSTIIHAKSIGDNFWINQNVTIGNSGKGIPQIGNNVRVGTGAVVLGPITIGDNVIIGANATVVKDVPANSTVVPLPSYIIKKDGERVSIKL